uniref:Aromatic amino acid beta-eliminating lyase/threonine aldolase domain-containing protein n=1 Tax=Aegilops tauschii TaxID=37682 RepID=M8CA36_AEGTA
MASPRFSFSFHRLRVGHWELQYPESYEFLLKRELQLRRQGRMVTKVVAPGSDTVTNPSEAMRAAMAAAEVDDDVLGADPTAQRLEAEMARVTGKEAALFVPSGTMGNLVSVLTQCDTRGSEVILGDSSHIHMCENGGISTIGGVHPRTVRNNPDGTMDIDMIVAAIRHHVGAGALHYPTTRLICLENTHGRSGGKCLSVEYIDKVGQVAQSHGLKLHIDGARIFNASVALGVPVDKLVRAADSVSARILRKTLGGGMRQMA